MTKQRVYIVFWGEECIGITSTPALAEALLAETIRAQGTSWWGYHPGEIGVAEIDGDYLGLLCDVEAS